MTELSPVIFWFREDLRLSDNPALHAARRTGAPVICIYILDEESAGRWRPGAASKWWLHHSLRSLSKAIENTGNKLVLRRGDPAKILPKLASNTGAERVFWNRRYAPYQIEADKALKSLLADRICKLESHNGRLLYEPWEIQNKSGDPYRVFTPFWKALKSQGKIRETLPGIRKIIPSEKVPQSDGLEDWNLLPVSPDWASGFSGWVPGEDGAADTLSGFIANAVNSYDEDRNRPDLKGTSRLSPHLQFGEISPVQIWWAIRHKVDAGEISSSQGDKFLSEIAWREFSNSLIYHNPQMLDQELMPKFQSFPWKKNKQHLNAWQMGRTGYPMVDAGMRELWQTGWMHNRVRMIVGSFLVKHLRIDWREGMRWFWDTLLDADIANNTAGWQWIAGCGADAAPYFRIFNPVTQGEKFDPQGCYVRKYVPELKALPDKYLHSPWTAPQEVLEKAGVTLGETYPEPVVDHAEARKLALAAYEEIK